MVRRLLIAVLVLIVAAVVTLDRVGAHVAGHVLAGKLQTDEHLPHRPSVSIGGIPFLTQAIGGDYHDVSVTAHDFKTPGGVTVTTLNAHLRGAHIPLSKVVHGSVSTVPVDHVDGTAFVSFGLLSRFLAGQGVTVTLSRASPHSVKVLGQPALVMNVVVHQGLVQLSGAVRRHGVTRGLVYSLPLQGLPFRLNITSVTVGAGGITASGTANHVRLGS